jgi:hypothetical protein
MKKLIFPFVLVFITSGITRGGDDSLFVEIKPDTLLVWNTNVWENCAFSPVFIVEVSDSIISITEKDTSTDHTTCAGYSNYCIPVTGLAGKEYTIKLWRSYSAPYYPDTAEFITSLKFNFAVNSVKEESPPDSDLKLYEAFPNPFNPGTTISYSIPEESFVLLTIYNSIGQLVKVLVNEKQRAGKHKSYFDAESLSNGVYYYQLVSGNKIITKKIILLK